MKVVILAGGRGTRLNEETVVNPKPMVEIGGNPILWHIMKIYSHFGFDDFIICLGYKGYVIREYFAHYRLHQADIEVNLRTDTMRALPAQKTEPWRVSLIDTGLNTMTGGRLKRIEKYLDGEPFMLTYGDGLANIDLNKLLQSHIKHQRVVTVTAVKPPVRYGLLEIKGGYNVTSFQEKPKGEGGYVSGGFFVCEQDIFDYLKDDQTVLEHEPLESLAGIGQMSAYRHSKFWYAMDTLKDKNFLEARWAKGNAPWVVW